MNGLEKSVSEASGVEDTLSIEGILRSITEQFEIIMGRPERVAESCAQLKIRLTHPPNEADIRSLHPLFPLLTKRTGPIVFPLFDLLEEIASTAAAPQLLIFGMIPSLDKSLAYRALKLTLELMEAGSWIANYDLIRLLAAESEIPGKPLSEPDLLPMLGQILRCFHPKVHSPDQDTVLSFFLDEQNGCVRRLAARILDKEGEPISAEISNKILGADAAGFLFPYFAYTRAGFSDVLSLLPLPGKPPPALPLLRQAENDLGESLLREVIAEVGWPRLNLGLEVYRYARRSIGSSIPLMLKPAEAALFEYCGESRPLSDVFLITAHGTVPLEETTADKSMDAATLFRFYNLGHAELLSDFLAVAPLTEAKVRSMLERMDRIVDDFCELFSHFSEECSVLPDLYEQLKNRISPHLESYHGRGPLSADLTRLVMMFEDPRSLSEVHTLHGLKRYLHQRGLQLGFRLVLRSRSTHRTVDMLLASQEHVLENKFKGIRYSDFEPESEGEQALTHIPYPVRIVMDGFSRQLIYGQAHFPRTDIFCYGNEVHYYLSFRNHPAFLRINLAPPLQGGMIDLEYFGVSKYELAVHPDLSLFALKRFFQYLEFDIQIEDTRVHARYDKEHAHDLESLCHKAEGIFRLAPYLLEIDWTIGGLKLDAEARMKVAEKWAAAFAHWGILPLRYILNEDRTGVVESVATTPSGKKEILWDGKTPYRDRLTIHPPKDFYDKLCTAADHLDIDITPARLEDGHRRFGQIRLERWLLLPLRNAVSRGEIAETPEGYRRVSSDLFHRVHEAEYFAEILSKEDARFHAAVVMAGLITPLERTLDFRITGSVNGHETMFARLPLRGSDIGIYVLRGEKNTTRLAFFSKGTVLFRRRNNASEEWHYNAVCDASEFISILRRSNYPVASVDFLSGLAQEDIRKIRLSLTVSPVAQPKKLIPGERLIKGLSASPGRTVGRVMFEVTGKKPEDFDGRILVAAAVRPEDNAFIYHAAGIVSTGGGILSHAGLLATQFRKPSIIISGQWETQKDTAPLLRYLSTEYELLENEIFGYPITTRVRIREREHVLREGDLAVLDANGGFLRALGQDHDTLALHEALCDFGEASFNLSQSTADHDILSLRGRRLRARHQIEKILTRLTQPILACHATYELLLGRYIANRNVPGSEKAYLLQVILHNPDVGNTARDHLKWIVQEIHQRYNARLRKAEKNIPRARSLYEILNLRLDVLQTIQSLDEAGSCLKECGFSGIMSGELNTNTIDREAEHHLLKLRKQFSSALTTSKQLKKSCTNVRHRLREIERIDRLIGLKEQGAKHFEIDRSQLDNSDASYVKKLAERNIIYPNDGGFELYPLIGWKAANLGEIGKCAGAEWVPSWFAVTDHAFRTILESPIQRMIPKESEIPEGANSLQAAIETILRQTKWDTVQKSFHIRSLWDTVILPKRLSEEVISAYRALSVEINRLDDGAYVAIRSSSREEDAEIAARAGEFETFLFICGEKNVLKYLKRTWSGLWSERAIHNRAVLGSSSAIAGGGVIIQRIVDSRISGVIQTVNVGRNEMSEIVINAGLGLGEGIVAGIVAADQIVVSKDHEAEKPLQFTYVTADKKEYVVFNKKAGLGTIRCRAPYHKRLRPALEYVELCELIEKALHLETAYGYPLDIEFAIEGTRAWILQARPVPVCMSAYLETIHKYPILLKPGTNAI